MYYASKIVWALINPYSLIFIAMAAAVVLAWKRRRKAAAIAATFAFAALWFFSSGLAVWMLGLPLESPYTPERLAEDYETADAIVLLGGGMSFPGDDFKYGDCNAACDRVWHAARLYAAGKAPVVVASGTNDLAATALLLKQAGVPETAMKFDGESRNTAENFANTAALFGAPDAAGGTHAARKPRVLVVTSAWHMRRALLLAERAGLDAIPAPCDYMAAAGYAAARREGCVVLSALSFGPENLHNSCILLKEWVGWLQKKICG